MNSRYGIPVTIASAAIFGLWPPAASVAYAEGANPMFMILLTTLARAGSLLLFCLLTQKALFANKQDAQAALLGGSLQSVSIFCLISAVAYLPGSVVIIILFSHTLVLLFMMAWRGEIKLTRMTLLSTLAALGGLTLVVDLWHTELRYSPFGLLLAFAASLATANRAYIYGHQTKTRNAAVVGAEAFTFSALIICLGMLFVAPVLPQTTTGWLWALVGTLSLVIGTFGMFYGIAMIGSFRFSLFLKLEPVCTAIFSYFILSEVLDWGQYIGMAIVMGSLITYQISAQRQKTS